MQDETVNVPVWKRVPRQILWAMVVVLSGLLIGVGLALFVILPESLPRIEQGIASLIFDAPGVSQSASGAGSIADPAVGQSAPDFTLKTLDGGEITLADLRGQPVLINFWASWCGPCQREMPELIRVYENHKEEGFVVLALNLTHQDAVPEVEAFVEEFDMPFPVPLDETGDVATELYRLRGVPTSVFIDRGGVFQRLYIGAMTGEQLDQFVAEILQ